MEKMPMVMDCPPWNVGWNAASFAWEEINPYVYHPWAPFYAYRHPGITANVLYMDGHVGPAKSFYLGKGPRVFWRVYDTDPDGTPPTSGIVYEVYPY
jgi:prepilin-type processing-associated H-X9-DG protein